MSGGRGRRPAAGGRLGAAPGRLARPDGVADLRPDGIATGLGGDPAMRAMCAPQGLALLGGMPPMYALMSVFHLGPWMRLVFGR